MMNAKALVEFESLLTTVDTLLGPEGCPWDQVQTLVSMRESVLEEACEVIEAIDEGKDGDLIEELGDLLYNVLFFSKLAQKEGRFEIEAPIRSIREKLVARHPHVFEGKKLADTEAIVQQWEQIKKQEKPERESLMDGIPKGLPALARAYKIAKKMDHARYLLSEKEVLFENEEELGELLWLIVRQARNEGLNPELALRKEMLIQEREFREWESAKNH